MIQDSRIQNSGSLTHHAYMVEGGTGTREELFKKLQNSWGIATKGNPDFSYQKFQTLTIDEARNLKESQERKAFTSDGKKIIVIEADAITDQAQNSLLKIFEEPTPDTHFFLIGACVKNLIPTLASRFSVIKADTTALASDAVDAVLFLKLSLSQRFAMVKKLADDIKDEKKTKNDALILLQQIEATLYQKAKKDGELSSRLFEDLEMCRDYLSDRSASVKTLLEYTALVAPVLK